MILGCARGGRPRRSRCLLSRPAFRRTAAARCCGAGGGRPAPTPDRRRADRQPRHGHRLGDDGPVRRHRRVGHLCAHRDAQRRNRHAAAAPSPHAGRRPPGPRPTRRPDREDGVAGVVVKGKFPRRRTIQVVATNLVRYIFGGAARNWIRNISSTAPALGSMTLLLLLTGLVGLCGYAIHNLERIETSQAALLHVYMADSATTTEVDALWDR